MELEAPREVLREAELEPLRELKVTRELKALGEVELEAPREALGPYLEDQVEWRKFVPGWEADEGFA